MVDQAERLSSIYAQIDEKSSRTTSLDLKSYFEEQLKRGSKSETHLCDKCKDTNCVGDCNPDDKNKKFECAFCDAKYTRKASLKRHCKQQHPHRFQSLTTDTEEPAKKHICSECSVEFSRKDNLNRHTKEKHQMKKRARPDLTPDDELRSKEEDAKRKRVERSLETLDRSMERKSKNAANTSKQRSLETPDRSMERKTKDAANKSKQRSLETPDRSMERKTKDAANTSKQRSLETPDRSMERKTKDVANKSKQRSLETPDRSMERKSKDAANTLKQRSLFQQTTMDDTFPPVLTDDNTKGCIADYLNATSNRALKSVACGICGELVTSFKVIPAEGIPGRQLLQKGDQKVLPHYDFGGILLCREGVNSGMDVNCCDNCCRFLRKGKLPPLSVANGFQLGVVPPELVGLTLPEQLLISVYHPKIYVTTIRSYLGPKTQQHGLEGNTITFPQDIVTVAKTLPAEKCLLLDKIKVVFIGKGRPNKDGLRKVFTVRKEKVIKALRFLISNHPLYKEITLNEDIDLPDDDIPDEIWNLIALHDDVESDAKEHATYVQTDVGIPDDPTQKEDLSTSHQRNVPSENQNGTTTAQQQDPNDSCHGDIPATNQQNLVSNQEGPIVMESSGLLDLEGHSVTASSQIHSAANSLQGTLMVPLGKQPVTDYNNPLLWLGAYPTLFPYGLGGPEMERAAPVSLKAYIKHLLLLADTRFRKDIAFKFHVFNVLQKREVSLHTALQLRRPGFDNTAQQIAGVTHEKLVDLMKTIENKSVNRDPSTNALMRNLSSTGARIKGSPYVRKVYRHEIHGYMIKFGMPAFAVTVSPAGVHSPIVTLLAGKNIDLDVICDPNIPGPLERAQIVAEDPLAAAQYFNIVIDSFTKFLLGFGRPGGGVLGYVSAYYGCIEEQGTGTLHIHMLVWLQGFKSRSEIESRFDDENLTSKLLEYLEKCIQQGYMEEKGEEQDYSKQDVSAVTCRRPVDPASESFNADLVDDVNKLITVANTHRHTFSCYKYGGKDRGCRFGYPRDIVPESKIEDNEILLRRSSKVINNYNPAMMTCVRSNHDVKFIHSGKDGKAFSFYMTDYATKTQLNSHHMVPLVAASLKKIDLQDQNAIKQTRMLMTKCLNRINTEIEISAAHVCHFLLGNTDNKTSHSSIHVKLYAFMAWLADEMRKYDQFPGLDDEEEEVLPDEQDDDEEEEVLPDEQDQISYSIDQGNVGLVLVNQLVDYLHRGEGLRDICLYEYSSKIDKTKITADEERKIEKLNLNTGNVGRKVQKRHRFATEHPQSDTHIQRVRTDGLIPSLAFLPPDEEHGKDKYYMCMLVLFKPFVAFTDLYDGINWQSSYNCHDFEDNLQYILNIKEMHTGLQEKKKRRETQCDQVDNDVDTLEEVCEESDGSIMATASFSAPTDEQSSEVVSLISTTACIKPINNDEKESDFQRASISQQRRWKVHIKQQVLEAQESVSQECEEENDFEYDRQSVALRDDLVDFSVNQVDSVNYEELVETTSSLFTLNPQQNKVLHIITRNIIRRIRGEPLEQIIMYVGGPGGTGKSQIIKALVHFMKEVKQIDSMRLMAYTGTAAKNIGGSTISSSLMLRSKDNLSKLERIWGKVSLAVIDEISMVSCQDAAKISRQLTKAKHASPDTPFGGLDVVMFGDFYQFPPIYGKPLYHGYGDDQNIKASTSQNEVNKQLGRNLWKQLTHIALLTKQIRVTDIRYRGILDRLRLGECTDDDYLLLSTRVIGNSDQDLTSHTPIVVPGNDLRTDINRFFVSKCSDEKFQVFKAVDKCKKNISSEVKSGIASLANTKTNGLPSELPLFPGMDVYLTRNVGTEVGLTNSSQGVVRHVAWDGINELPDYVVVEFTDLHMPTPMPSLPKNHIPIFPVKGSFGFDTQSRKSKKQEPLSISRKQLPLEPAYACTSYKSQGLTLPNVTVDLVPCPGSKNINISFAYVPLSRVPRLQDLVIIRPFQKSILNLLVPKDLQIMMADFKERDVCKDL